jgi:signal transduction histidine kinase
MTLIRELLKGRAKRWLILILFWLGIGVLSALHWQLFFSGRDPYSWWELYRIKVVLWYVWGLLTPIIFWLGYRFPIQEPQALRNILILLPISVLFTLLYLVVYSALLMLNVPDAPGLFQDPLAMFLWVIGAHSTWYFLAFWASIGVENAVSFYRRYHERELLTSRLEAQLAEAQLSVLRSQLQPHFLFNTLHSIMALVNSSDNKAAIQMLGGLSDLLRHALEHVRRHEVPLREELDILRRYLAIESVRFSDRLTIEWSVAPESESAYVPSFILQPLAENALRHGIEKRPGPGVLYVDSHVTDDRLLVSFRDNGIGLSSASDDAIRNGDGHGLGDMRARLDVLYPNSYSLIVEPAEGSGTMVRLQLPFNTQPSHVPSE